MIHLSMFNKSVVMRHKVQASDTEDTDYITCHENKKINTKGACVNDAKICTLPCNLMGKFLIGWNQNFPATYYDVILILLL